jgi:hypothetical protein
VSDVVLSWHDFRSSGNRAGVFMGAEVRGSVVMAEDSCCLNCGHYKSLHVANEPLNRGECLDDAHEDTTERCPCDAFMEEPA